MKSADDPLRSEQNRERAGRACCFRVHRWNAAQFWIDLRNECAKLQLFGELARIEISNRACLNFCRIDLRFVDRFPSGFDDQVPDGFALLLEIALNIGAPTAENVNGFAHNNFNLANLHPLSSWAAQPGWHFRSMRRYVGLVVVCADQSQR